MIGHFSLRIAFKCYVVKSEAYNRVRTTIDCTIGESTVFTYLSTKTSKHISILSFLMEDMILKCQPVSTKHMTYENEINNWQNSLLLQILIRSEQYFLFSFKNFRIIICKLKIKYALFSKIWESVTYNWVCLTIVKLCDISNVLHLPLKNDQ